MFNFFCWRSHGAQAMPSLNSLQFDATGDDSRGEPLPGRMRVWFTPGGDDISLYYCASPPDLPKAKTLEELRAFYTEGGENIVELSLMRLDGCQTVRKIQKTPQRPTGMTYEGSLIIPFRDFSFTIKVQCMERGCTGQRESVLLERRMVTKGMPVLDEDGVELPDWNPDDEGFDSEFPHHPVSRVRRILDRIAESVSLDGPIKSLPRFKLPEPLRA
jgi:hypothetical protein